MAWTIYRNDSHRLKSRFVIAKREDGGYGKIGLEVLGYKDENYYISNGIMQGLLYGTDYVQYPVMSPNGRKEITP